MPMTGCLCTQYRAQSLRFLVAAKMVAVGLLESGTTLRPIGKLSFLFLSFDAPQFSCDCLPFLLLPLLKLLHIQREPIEILPQTI
jgi:hypothetical protein